MKDSIRVVFIGDVMTHGNQIAAARRPGGQSYDFSGYFASVRPVVTEADIGVCNLETTLGTSDFSGFPRFCTPESMADAIAGAGFRVVAAANNHSYDRGRQGIIFTRQALERRGLQVIGTRKTPEEKAYAVISVKGVKVALFNFTFESPHIGRKRSLNLHPMEPGDAGLLNSFCFQSLEEDLAAVSREFAAARAEGAELLIPYFHWGEEYERTSNVLEKYVAWYAAQQGADAVIGSHPHVLQEMGSVSAVVNGRRKEVPVFYSLGNFIWGGLPSPGRDTVLQNVLADLRFTRGTDGAFAVAADYVPLRIDIHKENRRWVFRSVDLRDGSFPDDRAEIGRTLRGGCPACELRFDRVFTLKKGERKRLTPELLPDRSYVSLSSETAEVASVLPNGTVVGNSEGYAGVTAVDADGVCVCLMVRVTGETGVAYPVLVNGENRVGDTYRPAGRVSGAAYALPDDLRLCRGAAVAWKKLHEAAEAEGVKLVAVSGYRSKKEQLARINEYAAAHGADRARERYQPIGGSEHHLGLALDVAAGEGAPETAPAWLERNAPDFGFLPRVPVPEGEAYVHLRYLGDAALARRLQRSGQTLSDYLAAVDARAKPEQKESLLRRLARGVKSRLRGKRGRDPEKKA